MLSKVHITILFFCLKTTSILCDTTSTTAEDDDYLYEDDESSTFPKELCESRLPNCQCLDYEEVVGLECANLTDFEFFSRTLSDGSVFEANTTFEITMTGVEELPKGALRGLIVYRLFLDDTLMRRLDEGVFDGVYRLRRFQVRLSSLKDIPDFRPIRVSFRNLNLDNSQLTSLSGDRLKDLPLLETISFVNNSISIVEPDVFNGTENILIFDLSYNKLTFLPPHLMDKWNKLKKVVLSHNRLLHVNELFAIAHPEFIYLDWNNLTDLDSILHRNMTNVETVQLSYNPISQVTPHSFNGKVPNIRFLYMDHCLVYNFSADHFSDLSNLSTLDLSYNLVESVSNQTIGFGFSLEMHFVANRITHFNADLPHTVKRVYLSQNYLTSLGETLRFSQMSEVSMSDNHIETLDPEDFRGVHGVLVLDLQGNRIRSVHPKTFLTIRKDLVYLDLSRNRLRSLRGSVRFLSLLTALNLTDNLLQTLGEGEFTGLNELTELYLQGNQLLTLGNELHQLPQLQYLVISYNRIQTIDVSQIPKTLQYLYFTGNPFRCDCYLFPFLQHLNSSDHPETDVPLCTSPADDAPPPCPEPCSCTCEPSEQMMAVDCSGAGLQVLPDMFRTRNQSNELVPNLSLYPTRVSTSQPPFYLSDSIAALDLSDNNLGPALALDTNLPQGLRRLRIDRNGLRDPPPVGLVPEGLSEVNVARNPWRCDCGTVLFKSWIVTKGEMLLDGNETRCGPPDSDGPHLTGRLIGGLTDIDLCPSDIGLYASFAFGVLSFFLVIAGFTILYTRYELQLKVWLYAHGVTWVKEKDIDRDKAFDAFVSFSNEDVDFVMPNIIKVLEAKAPNVHLCIHNRDFVAGYPIHINIEEAVARSKRTVLIVSKNFCESEWCMFEFQAAHSQALKDHVHRVVVIRLGDLPEEMDPTLQLYLDNTTYLTWGEKYFWENLFYALPTSSRCRNDTKLAIDV